MESVRWCHFAARKHPLSQIEWQNKLQPVCQSGETAKLEVKKVYKFKGCWIRDCLFFQKNPNFDTNEMKNQPVLKAYKSLRAEETCKVLSLLTFVSCTWGGGG